MPVYKDKKRGTWYVSIRYKNWAEQPERKVKRGFKLERDAKKWEREFMAQQAGTCDMPLHSLTELYFDDMQCKVETGEMSQNTIDRKRNNFDVHILPYFGETPVNQITPAAVKRWHNTLIKTRKKNGKPYAPTYLHSLHSQLSAVLNYAVTFYNLDKNPCKASGSMGKKKAPKFKFWTLDEFNKVIVQVTEPVYHLAFMILYWGGLREGECLNLRPASLKGEDLDIRKTYHRRNGEDAAGKTKSPNSVRRVSMPDFVIKEWKDYTSKLYGLEENDRVFYFGKGILGRHLDKAAEAAGVKRIRLHDLRHSHVALLVELGYRVEEIAERIGDSVAVVTETYVHLYPGKQKKIAAELSKHRDGFNTRVNNIKKDASADQQ